MSVHTYTHTHTHTNPHHFVQRVWESAWETGEDRDPLGNGLDIVTHYQIKSSNSLWRSMHYNHTMMNMGFTVPSTHTLAKEFKPLAGIPVSKLEKRVTLCGGEPK